MYMVVGEKMTTYKVTMTMKDDNLPKSEAEYFASVLKDMANQKWSIRFDVVKISKVR